MSEQAVHLEPQPTLPRRRLFLSGALTEPIPGRPLKHELTERSTKAILSWAELFTGGKVFTIPYDHYDDMAAAGDAEYIRVPIYGVGDPITQEQIFEDVVEEIDFRKGEEVDVAGLSLGGLLAVRLAAQFPEYVRQAHALDTSFEGRLNCFPFNAWGVQGRVEKSVKHHVNIIEEYAGEDFEGIEDLTLFGSDGSSVAAEDSLALNRRNKRIRRVKFQGTRQGTKPLGSILENGNGKGIKVHRIYSPGDLRHVRLPKNAEVQAAYRYLATGLMPGAEAIDRTDTQVLVNGYETRLARVGGSALRAAAS